MGQRPNSNTPDRRKVLEYLSTHSLADTMKKFNISQERLSLALTTPQSEKLISFEKRLERIKRLENILFLGISQGMDAQQFNKLKNDYSRFLL